MTMKIMNKAEIIKPDKLVKFRPHPTAPNHKTTASPFAKEYPHVPNSYMHITASSSLTLAPPLPIHEKSRKSSRLRTRTLTHTHHSHRAIMHNPTTSRAPESQAGRVLPFLSMGKPEPLFKRKPKERGGRVHYIRPEICITTRRLNPLHAPKECITQPRPASRFMGPEVPPFV